MEKLLTCPNRLSIGIDHRFYQAVYVPADGRYVRASHACKLPIAQMGSTRFARCLQGGGVAVFGGTVTISSCTISGNTASAVRAHPQKFPIPPWESC